MPSTETAALPSQAGSEPAAQTRFPFVSVIVPTRNRGEILAFTLDALARQVYPSDRMELLVIDNSSTDDTEAVVGRWAAALPFPVRFQRKENKGPASSRNLGAQLARGEVLAFTDSDCLPSPAWLRSAVAALEPGVGVVTGPIALQRTADTHFFWNSQLDPEVWDSGLYRTANLVVRKAVFEEVSGFDESYALGPRGQLMGGEDTDLGWRIRRSGLRAVFVEGALITHLATQITPREWLLKPIAVQVLPRLVASVPELRSTALWARCFMSPRNFLFDLGAFSVVAAWLFHTWPLLLLTLPWLYVSSEAWYTMLRLGRIHKAAAIFALLVQRYSMVLGVLLWASVRYRRLVL